LEWAIADALAAAACDDTPWETSESCTWLRTWEIWIDPRIASPSDAA
jgi:hypothetical protein